MKVPTAGFYPLEHCPRALLKLECKLFLFQTYGNHHYFSSLRIDFSGPIGNKFKLVQRNYVAYDYIVTVSLYFQSYFKC